MQGHDLTYDTLSGDSLCRTDFVYPGLSRKKKKRVDILKREKNSCFLCNNLCHIKLIYFTSFDFKARQLFSVVHLLFLCIFSRTVKAAG